MSSEKTVTISGGVYQIDLCKPGSPVDRFGSECGGRNTAASGGCLLPHRFLVRHNEHGVGGAPSVPETSNRVRWEEFGDIWGWKKLRRQPCPRYQARSLLVSARHVLGRFSPVMAGRCDSDEGVGESSRCTERQRERQSEMPKSVNPDQMVNQSHQPTQPVSLRAGNSQIHRPWCDWESGHAVKCVKCVKCATTSVLNAPQSIDISARFAAHLPPASREGCRQTAQFQREALHGGTRD